MSVSNQGMLSSWLIVLFSLMPTSWAMAQPSSLAAIGEMTATPVSTGQSGHFEGMGPYRRTITTESKEAQRFFEEELIWAYAFNDLAKTTLEVSDLFIAGEIALQQERWSDAVELLERAVEIEDSLSYGEPPQWLQPIRHTLGAVYLKMQRYADAERVYRDDLERWPSNGWSLQGLSQALASQDKAEQALQVRRQYERAWSRADALTSTSCKCIHTTE